MNNFSRLSAAIALQPWIGVFFAYALGCLNTGYYLVRFTRAQDVRQLASGSAGATNVGRALGRWGFGVTLLGDMLKGALAIYCARLFGWSEPWQIAMLCAVVIGHNWPVQLGLRGGKGVATSFGALLVFDPVMMVTLLGVLAVFLLSIRKRVLSGMLVYLLIPLIAVFFGHEGGSIMLLAAMTALIVFSHGENLRAELCRKSAITAGGQPTTPASIKFKIATEAWEFEAIHRLNHRTFVHEIPQHASTSDSRLVDRFHSENTYVIAMRDRRLVGMMAVRGRRPFSLDAKVPKLDQFIPAGRHPVEVRLLAVEPAFRHTAVFTGLFAHAAQHCLEAGFDMAVISGTTRQLKLYRHLGFTPFGPLVGTAAAQYQPMFLTLERFARAVEKSAKLRVRLGEHVPSQRPLNFLPGPVLTTRQVDQAFAAPAQSHRSPEFMAQMRAVRLRLCALTGASQVEIIPGSGSLANAIVAAQLSLTNTSGLVISNGEFGERLIAEARRAQLSFDTLRIPWGTSFDLAQIAESATRIPSGGWIWFVHHETSTSVVNPLNALKSLAACRGLRLCVDCISSIGAQTIDLSDVHLASGTSGKGLGAYPGLALVFHSYDPRPQADRLPAYLDLGHWAEHDSVPHTHSSNLLAALDTALRAITPARVDRIRENGSWLRSTLRNEGYRLVAPEGSESPALVTIALEPPLSSERVGAQLERQGFCISFRSSHLLARNWIQIALLGDPSRAALEGMVNALEKVTASARCSNPALPNTPTLSNHVLPVTPPEEVLAR